MEKITGQEPVLPVTPFNKDDINLVEDGLYAGIRLRQLFAMVAMASLAGNSTFHTQIGARDAAEMAVDFADALINELNKPIL